MGESTFQSRFYLLLIKSLEDSQVFLIICHCYPVLHYLLVFACFRNYTFVLILLYLLLFHLGHGGTDGIHGYVHSLDYAVTDLVCFRGSLTTLVADVF